MRQTEKSVQLDHGRNYASVKGKQHGSGRHPFFSGQSCKTDQSCRFRFHYKHGRKGSIELIFKDDIDPEKYVEEKGLKTVNDEGALRETVQKILAENPQSVEDYHNGKEKAIGFLVGQTMKAMKGKANPALVNQILKELL